MALIKSTSHKAQFSLLDAAVLVLLVGAIASAAVFFTTEQRVEQTKAQRDSIQLKKILTTEPQLNTDEEKLFYCIGIEQRQGFDKYCENMGAKDKEAVIFGIHQGMQSSHDPIYRAYYSGISVGTQLVSAMQQIDKKTNVGDMITGFSHGVLGKQLMSIADANAYAQQQLNKGSHE